MSTLSSVWPERQQRVLASPRARRLLRQLGLDPRTVRGSGPGGRIVEADVKASLAKPPAAVAGKLSDIKPTPTTGGVSVMRRAIAEKTVASFSSVPHFYLRAEADVTALLELRQRLVPEIERERGVKLSLTDLLVRAMARTATEFPYANQIWQNDSLVALPTVDIGLVVGLPDGLLIPVLRDVNKRTLAGLARLRFDSTVLARAGKLTAAQTQGGAMSLSNLGNTPVDEFAAVIALGQSSMLAVGRAAPRPFVVDGQLAVRTTLRLCLSVDHRVMDGAPAGSVLGRIVDLLEHPSDLISQPAAIPVE